MPRSSGGRVFLDFTVRVDEAAGRRPAEAAVETPGPPPAQQPASRYSRPQGAVYQLQAAESICPVGAPGQVVAQLPAVPRHVSHTRGRAIAIASAARVRARPGEALFEPVGSRRPPRCRRRDSRASGRTFIAGYNAWLAGVPRRRAPALPDEHARFSRSRDRDGQRAVDQLAPWGRDRWAQLLADRPGPPLMIHVGAGWAVARARPLAARAISPGAIRCSAGWWRTLGVPPRRTFTRRGGPA